MTGSRFVARRHQRVAGLGGATMVLIGVVAAFNIASTMTTWNAYGVVRDYLAGEPGVTEEDLDRADQLLFTVSVGLVLAAIAAAVVFMVWLWRARANAEALCPAPHRRHRLWVVFSWFTPVVNFWFPFMIVDDVYRASRPDNPPDLDDLRTVPGSPLLGAWWALWLVDLVLGRVVAVIWRDELTVESLRTSGVVESIASAATVGAAVTIIMIMRRITGWQSARAAGESLS